MAENRSVLIHALNISVPYAENSNKYALVDVTTELSESFEPDIKESRYITQDTTTTTITGYKNSFEANFEYTTDSDCVNFASRMFINKPVGSAANSDYLRFLMTDLILGENNKYFGVKQPCTVAPSEIGGSADDPLGMTMAINGRGNSISGYITVSKIDNKTEFSFEKASTESPTIQTPKNNSRQTSDKPAISGTGIPQATITIFGANGELGTATVNGSGNWNFTPPVPLPIGKTEIIEIQKIGDMASIPSLKVTFTVDTATPTKPDAPEFLYPAAGSSLNTATPTIVGTGLTGAEVTIERNATPNPVILGTTTVLNNKNWIFTPAEELPTGSVTLTATQKLPESTVKSDPTTLAFTVST